MLRRFVLAATVMVCTFAFAYSETLTVRIYSVDGSNVVYKKTKKDETTGKAAPDGDNITGKASADVVVEKAGINAKKKKTDPIPLDGGLKNELFTKIDATKGVAATITIDDDGANKGKVTKIFLGGKGGGKKGA